MRIAKATADWPRGRFDLLAVAFHWLTALLVLALLASGFSFDLVAGSVWFMPLLALHRSMGAGVWVLTALRYAWRGSFASFPAFPENLDRVHHIIVVASEFGLYGLLFLQPLTGLMATLLRGRPFELFVWTVPALLPRMSAMSYQVLGLHEIGAVALSVLVGSHAVAALIHHYVARNDILAAMAPWMKKRRGSSRDRRNVSAPAKASSL